MSAELALKFPDADIVLFAEGKGIFDVIVDDRKVFSKYDTGRFPEPGEVGDGLN